MTSLVSNSFVMLATTANFATLLTWAFLDKFLTPAGHMPLWTAYSLIERQKDV